MNKKYYVTTPIYFPSDKLHIGHAYTTVAADTIKRYKTMRGYDVKFLTGTDEHGQKIERIAKENGVSPKEYVDNIVAWIKDLWKFMDIDYDIYIRTTDEKHEKTVQKIFKKLYDQGDIYKGAYEGLYCTPCETYFTKTQLSDGNCPDCGRPVETVKEESYFFRLSKYQEPLKKFIAENPDFISPESRRNEMINNFLNPGLEDLAVSRTSFKWGIPVSFDPDHIVYVWIDALSNYISALGYGSEDDSDYKKYWPADVHLTAKEIVRFHTIIWPAMLMALGEPLPKQVFGHGWIVIDGGKMSKSKGNVVDPKVLVERYGIDAIRYFLLREIVFGQDGNFSNEALIQRINSDLANDLGNLVSRTVGMIDKYFGCTLPDIPFVKSPHDEEISALAMKTAEKTQEFMDKFKFNDALSAIWVFIRRLNKYIDECEPWKLVKDEEKKGELANVMYMLTEGIRIISILITPVMPHTPTAIDKQMPLPKEITGWDNAFQFGLYPKSFTVTKGEAIFPRIDVEKELAYIKEELEKALMQTNLKQVEKKEKKEMPNQPETITIDDFAKLKMRAGQIKECEKVAKSKKLLKCQVDFGNGKIRQIIAGMAEYYTPEEMVGKRVVAVVNLKPAKLAGEMSNGMILAAEDAEGKLSLLTTESEVENGADIR